MKFYPTLLIKKTSNKKRILQKNIVIPGAQGLQVSGIQILSLWILRELNFVIELSLIFESPISSIHYHISQ